MQTTIRQQTHKKATNLSINAELLQEAKELKINLSATLEKTLTTEIAKRKRELWIKNNKAALENCNAHTEKHGLFSDDYRVF